MDKRKKIGAGLASLIRTAFSSLSVYASHALGLWFQAKSTALQMIGNFRVIRQNSTSQPAWLEAWEVVKRGLVVLRCVWHNR